MIDEPPRLSIRRRPPAPAAALLQPFLEAPTGWLIDAMAGRGAMDAAIKPLAAEVSGMRRFVGMALTCWCGPNDNLALLAAVALEADEQRPAGGEGEAGEQHVGHPGVVRLGQGGQQRPGDVGRDLDGQFAQVGARELAGATPADPGVDLQRLFPIAPIALVGGDTIRWNRPVRSNAYRIRKPY